MNIKGTAVKVLPEFIKKYHPDLYEVWFENLSAKSRQILQEIFLLSDWYPLYESAVEPVEVLAKLIEKDEKELAFEIGKFSAQIALKGVYKFFTLLLSASSIIRKATVMFEAYYKPVEVIAKSLDKRKIKVVFGKNNHKEILIYYRIKGWISEFILVTQKSDPKIELSVIDHMDDFYSAEFIIEW